MQRFLMKSKIHRARATGCNPAYEGSVSIDEDKYREELKSLQKKISRLHNAIYRKRIPFVMIGENERYINYVNETVVRTQAETKGTVPEVGTYDGEKVYQILAFVPEHQKKLLDELLDECAVTSWNDTGIDIIPKNGGKSAGIQRFLDEHGLDRSEIMAFGDGENDMEMLRFAGIGVAMGNASDSVKAAADYVTDTVDNDGIEKALRHFGLIE